MDDCEDQAADADDHEDYDDDVMVQIMMMSTHQTHYQTDTYRHHFGVHMWGYVQTTSTMHLLLTICERNDLIGMLLRLKAYKFAIVMSMNDIIQQQSMFCF